MYRTNHGSLACFFTARISRSCRNVIEEALDVQIYDPVIAPTSLPRLSHCIQRRLPWSIPIGIRMEQRIHRSAPDLDFTTICAIRSDTVGTVSANCT